MATVSGKTTAVTKNIDETLQEILAKCVKINENTSKTSNQLIDWESLSKSIGDGGAAKVILDLLAKYGWRGLASAPYRTNLGAIAVGGLSWVKGKSEQIEAERVKRLDDATSQARQMIENFFRDASPEQLQTALERLDKMSKGVKAEIAERKKMWEQEMAQLSKQHDHVQMYMNADSLNPSTSGTYDQTLVDQLAILNAIEAGLVKLQERQKKAIKPETIKLEVSNKEAFSNTQSNTSVSSKPSPTPKVILQTTNNNRAQQSQPDHDKLSLFLEKQGKHQERMEQERSNYETQASLMWQNSRGMLSNTDTLAGLRDMFSSQQATLLAGGIDAENPANWTPAMRSNYDQQIQMITKELNPALESMRAQYENNGLAVEDYQTKLAGLKETYTGYPEILQLVEAEERRLAEAERLSAESKGRTVTILQQAYDNTQRQLDNLAGNTLVQLGDSFAAAIVKGESLGDSLKKLGDDILYLVVRAMMLKMLNGIFGSMFGGGGSPAPTAFTGPIPYTGWISDGTTFAKGGIVGQPTLFGFPRGIGLMGEAGPEAIMPLARDGRGNLGVRIADSAMYGAGAASGVFAPHIEINIENSGGGDMTDEQARALGTQINAAVEMQVAKQMYDYARSGIFRSGAGRGY